MKLIRLTTVILSLILWGISTTNSIADSCTGFTTYTQGGWGADPHGNNAGVYLQNNFAAAFPNGLTIGCGSNLLVLTTDTAVHDFLPSGGTPSTLPAGTLTNPGQGYSNTFAGQLVTVTLNVVFDQYDPNFSSNSIHVADLIVQSGPFAGQTVSQVIAEANDVIGGCSTSYSVDDLNTALDNINNNYDNGTSDDGFLGCSSGCTISLSGTSTNITCYGSANGSIDMTVSGAQGNVSYLWNDGVTTEDRSGLAPGKYWVTATDQGSCKASDTFNISQPDSIHLSQTHINVSITGGSDGSIDLSVSGGTGSYTYLWSNGATTQDLLGLTAGTYSVVVTDYNGCQDSLAVIIIEPNCSLSINGTTSNDKCYGSTNGSIDVTVSGAQGSVSYLWNDGVITEDRSGLAMGTYSVTVTDEGGCAASDTFSISQPDSIHLGETHANVSSSGAHDGSITLTVTGGTPPYKYLWSNGKKTKNLKNIGAGTYTVVVTDANGCTATLTVVITVSTCACVPPTNITFGPPIKNKVQVCWNSVPCATGYIIKWKLSNKALWQYRTVNAPDTCTTFTWKPGQTDLIYFATICSDGDTTAYGQLYTYPPPSRESEVNTYPQFNVFPNPTSGHIMISLKNENFADQQVIIDVVNIFGQIVLHDKSELVNGGLTKSIELPNGLASGMYMVNITIGNKILHQQIVYQGK